MEAPTFLTEDQLWHKSDSYWFKRRADFIEAFIDEIRDPVGDMGEENPLIRYLGHKKDMAYTSIDDVDFDYEPIEGKYGTIFSFALLEHFFNPLFALENMKRALLPGGIIYLSTPYRPHFMWTEHHFHEIDDKRMGWLYERAGLRVVKSERVALRGRLREHLTGIRPLIRYFHKSMRLYKLRVDDTPAHQRTQPDELALLR
jgi:SAM-dependent methyltransferase